ncbi:hypothetical protein SAMN02745121_07378 [Nannocystis exedens]|uniref:Uncharacterized protein n=1 Tax=Nannocystis exedens TaxID=54 RepID=A0A1I2GM27_9BACT|nr:hypothetical protein [Nannocystis exedens]PCC73629.1 hypothetical protein NAEX_06717 [Nannocystis exedens]SFF18060.1 hypothetical protein SAMN02745121_07378 [Nannocystis exedens]
MRAAVHRLVDGWAAIRRRLQRYDRFVLVRRPALRQTRVHWIAPASAVLSLVGALIVSLPPVDAEDPLRTIDSVVSPLLFGAVLILVLWIRDQTRALVSFAPLARGRIAGLALLRLGCVAAILLPPLVVDGCMRARAADIAAHEDNVGVALAIVEAADRCLAATPAPGETATVAGLRERAAGLIEAARANGNGGRPPRGPRPAATRSAYWIEKHCHDPAASPSEDIERIERLHLYTVARVFPRPPLRALLYLLACAAVVVPFLALWEDRRGRAVGPAVALGLFFVVHTSIAIGWVPGNWSTRGLWLASLVAVSAIAVVAAPLAAWRRVRSEWCLLAFATAVIVVPLLPVALAWMTAAGGGPPGQVPCACLPRFGPAEPSALGPRELAAYAAGLGFCCLYIVGMGPTMHRLWAAPR